MLGGPAIAAISIADLQNMVDSLSGAESAILSDVSLVDSRADINIQVTLDITNTYNGSDNSLQHELPYAEFRDTANPQPSAQKSLFRVTVDITNTHDSTAEFVIA